MRELILWVIMLWVIAAAIFLAVGPYYGDAFDGDEPGEGW